MKVALDFDETITLDPLFWVAFIHMARASNHEVAIVTSRSPIGDNFDVASFADDADVEVIFCNGDQKATRHTADVWIDDKPESIPTYSKLHVELA